MRRAWAEAFFCHRLSLGVRGTITVPAVQTTAIRFPRCSSVTTERPLRSQSEQHSRACLFIGAVLVRCPDRDQRAVRHVDQRCARGARNFRLGSDGGGEHVLHHRQAGREPRGTGGVAGQQLPVAFGWGWRMMLVSALARSSVGKRKGCARMKSAARPRFRLGPDFDGGSLPKMGGGNGTKDRNRMDRRDVEPCRWVRKGRARLRQLLR